MVSLLLLVVRVEAKAGRPLTVRRVAGAARLAGAAVRVVVRLVRLVVALVVVVVPLGTGSRAGGIRPGLVAPSVARPLLASVAVSVLARLAVSAAVEALTMISEVMRLARATPLGSVTGCELVSLVGPAHAPGLYWREAPWPEEPDGEDDDEEDDW